MTRKPRHWHTMILLLPLVLTVLCLAAAVYMPEKYKQAQLPRPMPQTISGEYSYDGMHWMPLNDDSDLSARNDRLYLRGHLPYTLHEGSFLCVYQNHIGLSLRVNGQPLYTDLIASFVSRGSFSNSPSVCGKHWEFIHSPGITPEDELEIVLYNPHNYGNETAYRDFLSTLCAIPAGGEDILEKNLTSHTFPYRLTGQILIALSLLLLGISLSSLVIKGQAKSSYLFLVTLATLFIGLYCLFDTLDVSFWNNRLVLNTYLEHLGRMMGVFCCGLLVCFHLSSWRRAAVRVMMTISALVNCGCFVASIFGFCVIFDTLPIWAVSQLVLCPLMLLLCVVELFHAPRMQRLILYAGILLFVAVLLDIAGVGQTLIADGIFTKAAFIILLAMLLVYAVVSMWEKNQLFFKRTKRLERELEDSRIAIMLSQIKPHFLYNVLNSIYHLYRKSPETAQEAVSTFAEYLRNNMLSIERTEPIHFSEEYQHIQTYLSLEQIRFGDEVNVVYDVKTVNFRLPPLTVQPLVENAVKHGLTKKRGGGTVTVSTRETDTDFVITIADTGRGFDPEHYMDDGLPHIGINNVRQRLQRMMGGKLDITSSPDGTTAIVTLPKKEADIHDEDHRG